MASADIDTTRTFTATADAAEHEPLLPQSQQHSEVAKVPAHVARKIYLSHFFSTWNSRVFEFGSVLYLATIFPGTLLPMSVYAFVRGLSAILVASVVGQYIDTGDRLRVARVSIVSQRIAVAASCVIFYLLTTRLSFGKGGTVGMMVALAFLACVEKLGSIMNMVSIEKDWVVVVTHRDEAALRSLNAQMRRIDLLCKVLGPLLIALVDGYSTQAAIAVNFGMNVASVPVEYVAIARVYRDVPELQEPKQRPETRSSERLDGWLAYARRVAGKTASDFWLYFHHRAFLASMAGDFLEFTVLDFAGQMMTYLLAAGYTTTQLGLARTLSVVFEASATWVAPWLMANIGLVNAGLWLSRWQVVTLVAGIVVFWTFPQNPNVSATGLVGGTILSRVGTIGFFLSIQVIVQEEVEEENRGAFSSVEAAWQNAFELLSYASTIVFFRPEQFKWPALLSLVAVTSANLLYIVYVCLQRSRLKRIEGLLSKTTTQEERERGIERIISNTDV